MRSPDYGARVIDILPLIGDADSSESVVALFRAAVAGLGADAGVFMSYLRDDATPTPPQGGGLRWRGPRSR
jgi:hypothetical protein